MSRLLACAAATIGLGLLAWPSGAAPTNDVVEKLRAAHKAGDQAATRAQAALDNPDPWILADELLVVDRDAALAFASASVRPATAGLSAYVKAHEAKASDKKRRHLLRAATAERAARKLDEALATVGRPEEADVLGVRLGYLRGRILLDLSRHDEGAAQMKRAGAQAQTLGWLAQAAACAEHEARGRYRTSDFNGALEASDRWRGFEERLDSQRGLARVDCFQAISHSRLGKNDVTAKLAARAVEVGRKTGDGVAVANASSALAEVARRQGKIRDARRLYDEGVTAIAGVSFEVPAPRFAPDPSLVLRIHGNLLVNSAAFAFHFGEADLAWERVATAKRLAEQGKNLRLLVLVEHMTGTLRQRAGQPLVALKHYEQAAKSYRALNDRAREAKTLRLMATIQARIGDTEAAVASLDRALETNRALGVLPEVVQTLLAKGDALRDIGDVRPAAEAFGAAEHEAKNGKLTRLQRRAASALGSLHLAAGAYAVALKDFRRALAIARHAGESDGVVGALCDLMRVHAATGEPERAESLFDEAQAVLDKQPSPRAAGRLYVQFGRLLLRLDEFEDAEAWIGKGLAQAKATRDLRTTALAHSALAYLARVRTAWDKALRHGDAAAGIYAKLKEDRRAAGAEINSAMARFALGKSGEAKQQLEARLAKAEKAGVADVTVQCRWALAMIALHEADHAKSMSHAQGALEQMRSMGRFLAEGQGASSRAVSAPVFRIGASAALRAEDDERLYGFLEDGRSGTLLAAMDSREALRTVVIPDRLRAAERTARTGEAEALARLGTARASGNRRATRSARRALVTASQRLRDVVEEIQREARTAAGLAYPEPVARAKVRAALRPHEALVVYGILERKVVALVLLQDTERVVTIGTKEQIEDLGKRMLLDERPYVDPQYRDTARKNLIDALKLPGSVTQVLIAPDGILGYIPFSLLMPDYDIAFVPSASVYMRLLKERGRRGDGVLAVGDPDYSGRKLAALPATRKEAEAVGSVVLLGKDASETKLRANVSKQRWRAIHLGCHGLIDRENPTLSSLALASDDQNDGYLTALDVFGLNAASDLVVLSACDTGRGKIVGGEGIVGLTRAFLFAGSPRVIVSLWKVDDAATSALMRKFHALWNPKDGSDGMTPARALREAQAYVRSQKQWKEPYYWAAWVLYGVPD